MNHDVKIVRYANPGEEKELSTAALTSGLPYQRPVKQTVVNRLIGFAWALDKPTNAAYEIIPTRAIKSAYKLLGGPAFSRMLELMAGAWHGSQSSLSAGMIAGMALFLKTYETEIDDYDFVTRLSGSDPFHITQQAKVDFTTDKRRLRYARVIRKRYNEHRGGKKLRYRFKD